MGSGSVLCKWVYQSVIFSCKMVQVCYNFRLCHFMSIFRKKSFFSRKWNDVYCVSKRTTVLVGLMGKQQQIRITVWYHLRLQLPTLSSILWRRGIEFALFQAKVVKIFKMLELEVLSDSCPVTSSC